MSNHYGDVLQGVVGKKLPDPKVVARKMVMLLSWVLGALVLAVAIATSVGITGINTLFATDLYVIGGLIATTPWGLYYLADRKRSVQIDQKLPDFLRDVAESARAGLTLPRALVTAQKGEYGALNPEIKTMAAQVSWGISFDECLHNFAARTNTPLITRMVDMITEAERAGGNMVDVLSTASEDARELQQIETERKQQMATYGVVIYISYFVFLAVVMILVTQFVPSFKEAVSGLDGGDAQAGGLNLKDFDVDEFNNLFYQAALVQAVGGGLVGGVLTQGNAIAGLRSVLVMCLIAFLTFRVFV